MNAIKLLSCIFVLSAGLLFGGKQAAAQPVPIACGTAIDSYFSGPLPGQWLDVLGTRTTARGGLGFTSFTMDDSYSLATTPLNTPAAAGRSVFTANRGSSHYTGPFNEVFPGRGNNDVDRWDFWVYRTGALWLRSITWGGGWAQLQGVACFRGPQNQTVMTGYLHVAGYGTDFWTFVLTGDELI